MPAQLTTRAQVNGYRFLLQRFEHAMVRRDVRMLHDPMRIQYRSLITGLVLALLFTAGCAILSFIRPQGQVGQAKIVMGSDSGALYAVVDQTLHPVLNLASARLITGSAESPTSVKDAKLATMPRGPLLGVPGVPAALPGTADHDMSAWTLCDDVSAGLKTTVVAGPPRLGPAIRAAAPDAALLVSRNGVNYLVYQGKHARVDMGNTSMVEALGVRGMRARPVGDGLLNATVAVPDLVVPAMPGTGTQGMVHWGKLMVGAVIRVDSFNASKLYLVLPNGVQKLSPFAAEVMRSVSSAGLTEIASVPPDALSGVPVLDSMPLDQFPTEQPHVVSADEQPVACVTWSRARRDPGAQLGLLVGKQVPLAEGTRAVTLVDGGGGQRADAAYIQPATGEFVQVTGVEPDSTRRDGMFYITDTGVRFGIPDATTAGVLGLSEPKLAPWQMVNQLPAGPMLDRQAALVAHDTIGAGTDTPAAAGPPAGAPGPGSATPQGAPGPGSTPQGAPGGNAPSGPGGNTPPGPGGAPPPGPPPNTGGANRPDAVSGNP
ncbi:type VII secretion protein EccB [Nocardia sp. BMG111209]|uniref:type VII secretion protein EccB n=1 Tax=Nocardia sp. BMG111209 TaxID=1160137 RepID=UPI0003762192|nr:type VII secretion protein EccB [Nocardia sp. BMG111209]